MSTGVGVSTDGTISKSSKGAQWMFLLSLLILFVFQSYFLFTKLVPSVLSAPDLHAHKAIQTLTNLITLWFLLALISPVSRLLGIYARERRERRRSE